MDLWTFVCASSHRGETVFSHTVKTVSESVKYNSRSSTDRSNAEGFPLQGDLCPSNSCHFVCPCTTGSACHDIRPSHGPSIFFVPTSNVPTWLNELRRLVDSKVLLVKLVVVHASVSTHEFQITDDIKNTIRTVRDRGDNEARLPTSCAATNPKQRGFPSSDSSLVWILTTWNTWQTYNKTHFFEKHEWKHTKNREMLKEVDDIRRFHCGLAIVDECHIVKNVGKGPWGTLGDMKADRPSCRFWFTTLSGTILNANLADVAGLMDISGSRI